MPAHRRAPPAARRRDQWRSGQAPARKGTETSKRTSRGPGVVAVTAPGAEICTPSMASQGGAFCSRVRHSTSCAWPRRASMRTAIWSGSPASVSPARYSPPTASIAAWTRSCRRSPARLRLGAVIRKLASSRFWRSARRVRRGVLAMIRALRS
ncbi:hypothetical protein IP88_03165 [alpha proteobacterium AAP81b]|nr:hypothetical protein IP88_03165 [alpha proteobacterium AAP81b]